MNNSNYLKCKVCNSDITLVNSKHDLFQCTSCKLVFHNKIYKDDDFKMVYDNLYNSKDPRYFKHAVIEYENLKKGKCDIGLNRSLLIKRFVKKEHNILEVGSGIGLVGFYLKNKLKVKSYLGLEIDTKSHEKAKSLKINSINADFKAMKNIDDTYDVVMLWEVLEHIQDLDSFFKLAKSRLNNKGRVILSVPNYNKRLNYNDTSDNLYQSEPPIHLNFFTEMSLEAIFKTYGFKIVFFRQKKLPYFNKSFTFLKSVLKSFFGKYYGATLYVVAEKI